MGLLLLSLYYLPWIIQPINPYPCRLLVPLTLRRDLTQVYFTMSCLMACFRIYKNKLGKYYGTAFVDLSLSIVAQKVFDWKTKMIGLLQLLPVHIIVLIAKLREGEDEKWGSNVNLKKNWIFLRSENRILILTILGISIWEI